MTSTNGTDAMGVDFAGGRGAAALRRFAAGMQRRVFGGRVLGALLRAALLLAVPALLIAWWLPPLRPALLFAVPAVLLPVAIVTAVRAHLARRRVLLVLGDRLCGSPAAAAAHDELLTWLEFDARRSDARPALLDWLEHDVSSRLSPDERRELVVAARPSLGRFAWLLPLLLVLLLAWLLAELLAPPWQGVLGGSPPPPPPGFGNEGGGGAGNAQTQGGDGSVADAQQPEAQEAEAPPPDQPETAPENAPPEQPATAVPPPAPPPLADSPLLELPEQQRFVVPQFVDDGPTRRARMRAAEIEVGGGSMPPPPATPTGGEQPATDTPAVREQQFQHAAEQALRSRHVPEAERAIVRRFFDLLQQQGG